MPDDKKCNRGLKHKSRYCIATLCPEQLTKGHTLVILKKHMADITSISDKVILGDMLSFISKISNVLKTKVINEKGENPDRIYVCTLCDGVEHLHFHLIPRFPFSSEDKINYIRQIIQRDGIGDTINAVIEGKMGGFWYLALREARQSYDKMCDKQKLIRIKELEALAKLINNR